MKEKKLFIPILILLLFTNCDKYSYYSFFVQNNCPFVINFSMIDYKSKIIVEIIEINETKLVHEANDVFNLSNDKIECEFLSIKAVHSQDTTKVNYVDKDLWDFQVIDDEHANCYLKIDSVDFR